jgi:hypothetical protein
LHAGEPEGRLAAELRGVIAADRKELEDLMARLRITQRRPKRALAWVSEKFAELKMRLEDLHEGYLRRMELWEALSLGIEGIGCRGARWLLR